MFAFTIDMPLVSTLIFFPEISRSLAQCLSKKVEGKSPQMLEDNNARKIFFSKEKKKLQGME